MRHLRHLKKTSAIFLIVGAVGFALPARADLFGGDVAELAAILKQLIDEYRMLDSQLKQLQSQVDYAKQNTKQLDPTSFSSVVGFYNQAKLSYMQLKNESQAIDYSLQGVNTNFHKVFPPGKDLKTAKYSDYDPLYVGWQSEINATAQTAMRAQTNLSTLEANNLAAQQILRNSQSSNGQLQQLQAIVQILSIMQGQLSTFLQTLSTGNRVIATMAAGSATEKQVIRERKIRRTDGYTNAGKPSSRMTKLP